MASESVASASGDNRFRLRYGVRGGVSFGYFDNVASTFKMSGEDNAGFGGNLGFAVRYENPTRWYFESGLVANYAAGAVTVRHTIPGETLDCDISRLALQVPLLAGCKFCVVEDVLSMSVFLGPTFSVGLAGSFGSPEGYPHLKLYGDDGVWRRFNVAATFGVTFEIDRNFTVAVSGNLGLNSMTRSDIFRYSDATESTAQVHMAYWFD